MVFLCKRGFTLMEVMVVIAILSLLTAIAVPNYLSYRNKSFCSHVEREANAIAQALSDYFSSGYRTNLPDISDLKVKVSDPVTINGDTNETIIIIVKDQSGKCPDAYQENHAEWDAVLNTYSKAMN